MGKWYIPTPDPKRSGRGDGYGAALLMIGYAWEPTEAELVRQAGLCARDYRPAQRADYIEGFREGWADYLRDNRDKWGEDAIYELEKFGKSEAAEPGFLAQHLATKK